MLKKITLLYICFSISFSSIPEGMECDVLKLSYIKSDQLLGILKSMGYNVIEFEAVNSENFSDMTFEPNAEIDKPISIIKFPNSEISYLQSYINTEEEETDMSSFNSYIGSSPFPHLTSGDPLQRVLVCYETENIEPYIDLIEYVKNKIDVGAKQIMVDALVIEINSSDLKEVGLNKIEYNKNQINEENIFFGDSSSVGSFIDMINNLSIGASYSGLYTKDGKQISDIINLEINALLQNTSAEILSKPSVLVLDGRQARIQVGEQIPISKFPVTNTGSEFEIPDVEYLPVGITLNLRPRISDDNKQITMQVETIITETAGEETSSILSAPTISNRKVESFVRIANNTPFIVGGLISNKKSDGVKKFPFLHKIPLIGNLFKSTAKKKEKREVIVVITPHIIEDDYKKFSKVIPQDSDFFNSYGNKLFSNSYRLEEADIWDLKYITESNIVNDLRSKVGDDIGKKIPGEEIYINKMLYEIVQKTNYFSYVNPSKVVFWNSFNDKINVLKFLDEMYLNDNNDSSGIVLFLDNNNNNTFQKPMFRIEKIVLEGNGTIDDKYKQKMRELNSISPTIILTKAEHRKELIEVLILKYILEINEGLELSFDTFKRGLEIKFPNPLVLENNSQMLDSELAEMLYQVVDYSYTFEKIFNEFNDSYKE